LVGVIRRFLQGVKEATVEDMVGKDNVGHKHIKMNNYKFTIYLGFWFRKILFFGNFFILIRFHV
jgi:hypothetical protein